MYVLIFIVFVSLYIICHFSLADFKILSLVFSSTTSVCLNSVRGMLHFWQIFQTYSEMVFVSLLGFQLACCSVLSSVFEDSTHLSALSCLQILLYSGSLQMLEESVYLLFSPFAEFIVLVVLFICFSVDITFIRLLTGFVFSFSPLSLFSKSLKQFVGSLKSEIDWLTCSQLLLTVLSAHGSLFAVVLLV